MDSTFTRSTSSTCGSTHGVCPSQHSVPFQSRNQPSRRVRLHAGPRMTSSMSRGQSSLRLLERRFILSRERPEAHTLENCQTAGSDLLARSLSCSLCSTPPRDQTTRSDRPTPGLQRFKGPDCLCGNIRAGILQSTNPNSPRAPHRFPISRSDSFSRQQTRPASHTNGESHV